VRRGIGIVLGTVFAIVVMYALELLNHAIFPWREAALDDPAAMSAAILAAPLTAKVMLVGGAFLGTLIGGLAAVAVSRWSNAGWVVAGLMAALGLVSVLMIPHPLWMQIAAVLAPLLAGLVAKQA
jgi:hypothetical protein